MDKDLRKIQHIEETPLIRWNKNEPNEFLQQFVEKLKSLNMILSTNTYVKGTNKVLARIIEDAQNQTMILLIGMTGTGKTSLVNALLKRTVLSTKMAKATAANTMIRYGQKEEVKAYFLDGQVASFDLNQVELFTTSDTFSAEILREHLDYIEVYVNNDLLKKVIFIDTTPLEPITDESAYVKESILNRADDLYWIFHCETKPTEGELKLLEKLQKRKVKPLAIINAIDINETAYDQFMAEQSDVLSPYFRKMLGISVKNAEEAIVSSYNDEKWQQSQFDSLLQEIEKSQDSQTDRVYLIIERFIKWLKRFQTEVELIPQREPYLSAYNLLVQHQLAKHTESSRKQIENQKLSTYEKEYREASLVFKDVQTLYQLLQVISNNKHFKSYDVIVFVEYANDYLKAVREYRTMHQAYKHEYNQSDAQQRHLTGIGLLKNMFAHEQQNEQLSKSIEKLQALQASIEQQYKKILELETQLFNEYVEVHKHLNNVANNQLVRILNKVSWIHTERKNKHQQLKTAVVQLNSFNNIVEAKEFVETFVEQLIGQEHLIVTKRERASLIEILVKIKGIRLSHQTLIASAQIEENNDEVSKTQAKLYAKYHLQLLKLTPDDMKSEIEPPPALIQITE
ncbi:dynamin family protein [Viridibacillus sp. YIM B01967]|uniref:Dynamin family protein n=1 Tax=Viridibacillus soli TaxID=2798301 RepID=A0ABS1H442_9BACL|nr:dynamin family protein [Viridibacillus soli]MBK3494161.1 dynamin family protein [Viridibacillus soli]